MSTATKLQRSFRSHNALRGRGADRVAIGHALVDNCSSERALAAIVDHAVAAGEPAFVITPNAQHIVLLDKDPQLRQIYERADLVVPDGISLLLAARIYGRSLQQRVAGVDLFQSVCGVAAENNLHVFLLGGRPGSAELTAENLRQRFPGLRVSIYCPPLGFEKSPADLQKTADAVRSACPNILFVALGAPKQEYWIYEHGLKLSVPVCVGVGGTFEMVAGVVHRAPLWIQNLGCEWLYRLLLEPRRMWRRYLIGNLQFSYIVLRQVVRRALLNSFFSLLEKGSFTAELHERDLHEKKFAVVNLTSVPGRND